MIRSHERPRVERVRTGVHCVLVLALLLLASGSAQAGLIVVDTLDDEFNNDGDCSLREAVETSNTNTFFDECGAGQILGVDEIFVDVSGTIDLVTILPITDQVTIYGRGRNSTTLNGQDLTSILRIQMSAGAPDRTFDLRDIALVNGRGSNTGGAINLLQVGDTTIERVLFLNNRSTGTNTIGGAISSYLPSENNASLFINQSLFSSNRSADNGGAIGFSVNPSNGPPDALVIQESSFSGNTADGFFGGAVYATNVPIVVIDDSLFRNNATASAGGALFLSTLPGSFGINQLRDNTFLDNQAGTTGGAIQTTDGATIIRNSTFSGNEASDGAAVYADFEADTAIFHSTFVDNGRAPTSNGSVLQASLDAEISLSHSIVFSFDAAMEPECSDNGGNGVFTSLGHNIDASGTCTGHASDLPMTDPQLAPLGDYGDATSFLLLQTFLPLNGPAKDGGQNGPCPGGLGVTLSEDQRGEPRPTTAGTNRCDIGAVEVQPGSDPTGFPFFVDIGSGIGRVSSNPGGIDCPGDCIGQYLENSTVTLVAEPDPGYAFTSWSGACSGTNPTCQFTITGAGSATANFELTGFTLDAAVEGNANGVIVSVGPGGDAIDCPPSCSANYPEGVTIELLATAAPGAQFQNWAGNCSGSGSCIVTLDDNRRVIGIFTDSDTLFLDGFE